MGHSACSGRGHVPATWRPGVLAVLVYRLPCSGTSHSVLLSLASCVLACIRVCYLKSFSSQLQLYAICSSPLWGVPVQGLHPGMQSAILRQPSVRRALQLPVQSSEAGTKGRAWAAAGPKVNSAAASPEAGSIDQLFLQVRIKTSMCCMLRRQ